MQFEWLSCYLHMTVDLSLSNLLLLLEVVATTVSTAASLSGLVVVAASRGGSNKDSENLNKNVYEE